MTKLLAKLKSIKWKHYINYIGVGTAMLIFTILTLVGDPKRSTTTLLENITLNIILAVSLSLVVGFLGELSLGHAGFMCIGAYIGGKVSLMLSATLGEGLVNLIIATIAGALVAGVAGFVVKSVNAYLPIDLTSRSLKSVVFIALTTWPINLL